MNSLYRDFFVEVAKIPAENFCELRYEDLVRAPTAEISRIYRQLGLGSCEQVRPKLEAHLHELRGYKPNRHLISDQQRADVSRRWAWYMDRFGYRSPMPQSAAQHNPHSAHESIAA